MAEMIDLTTRITPESLFETQDLQNRLRKLNDFVYNELRTISYDIEELLHVEPTIPLHHEISDGLALMRAVFNFRAITLDNVYTSGGEKWITFKVYEGDSNEEKIKSYDIKFIDLFNARRRTQFVIKLVKEIQSLPKE